MKKKSNIVPLIDPEEQARGLFADQSIAFNLTLSRRMIALLQTVRDNEPNRAFEEIDAVCQTSSGAHQFLMFEKALQRRGLVIFTYRKLSDPGDFICTAKLSRLGRMVCDLLVECGLMSSQKQKPKKYAKN